jgi:hypothetical protein
VEVGVGESMIIVKIIKNEWKLGKEVYVVATITTQGH